MPASRDLYAIDCARRAAERAAAILHGDLTRGTISLHAIACTAPLLGLFGSALLLIPALRVPESCRCGDCGGVGVAETFIPIALSLPVAIFASWCLHCLSHQIARFNLEMRATTLSLLNALAR